MTKGWNDTSPRFTEERKHHVDRPAMMAGEPEFCWCGDQHRRPDPDRPEYWRAGRHPWPALHEEDS